MWPWRQKVRDEYQFICPLCDKSAPRREAELLYDHKVCRRCSASFTNRRAGAWIADRALFIGVASLCLAVLTPVDATAAQAAFMVIGWAAFPFRDGFRGRSPGKALFGLHVVSERDGEAIDWVRSLGRHFIFFVPFTTIIAAFQISQGKRIGDGLANTRVVWSRHASSRVFTR